MADVTLAFRARGGALASARRARARAGRVPAGHGAPGRQRRRPGAAGRGWWRCSRRCRCRPCFPLHPRTRARLEAAGLLDRLERRSTLAAAARLPRLPQARPPRARGADRLRRRAEGGLPARGPVRDAARDDRVDRDRRARLEPARGPRSATRRWRRSSAAPPGERPELYGGGQAAERVCEVLDAYTAAAYEIGIVGLGYVGLPLALAFAEAGHDVVGPRRRPRAGRGDPRRAAPRRGRARGARSRAVGGALRRDDPLRRPGRGRRDHDLRADPADRATASPTSGR